MILLDEVVACFHYDVVLIAEDGGDFVRDPLLHQVNVDLLNVDFLIELRWKFGRLEALLVNAERHGCSIGEGAILYRSKKAERTKCEAASEVGG